ncbi:ATP-binding protein [Aeromonas caviae]|uniref:ATP-binding protein n=1 Tax=Aeromonas caviae TaxID=648 RepID=UPI0029DDABC5|nr:ATP-binding protein [Aeromonas caviae]MDX7856434.1 ATP-binding protein [Aeromonas caviae]
MGIIKKDVMDNHLKNHPDERAIVTPFLDGFDIMWANKRRSHNTELSIYFLSPLQHYKESYGFENEVLLAYAPYKKMEPRTLQAIEQTFSDSPAKGRVETLNYFLISDDENISDWLDSYLSSKQETRIIVSFSKDELLENKDNGWYLRNKLSNNFFGRDLFNYSLPLVEDTYFFGRQAETMEYFDAVRRSENKGIFGLRKTGKTSLLFKVKRLCESERKIHTYYIDCKQPHIRKSRWFELLEDISEQIRVGLNIKKNKAHVFNERLASKSFVDLIREVSLRNAKICLMLDEAEYISFISPLDIHWKKDYLEFWQTLWSAQSQVKCLSLIIAGVNASIVETDLVDGVQNPLFGIVPHKYLTGFNNDECRTMLKKLGRRMGIDFNSETCEVIRRWYGGHPLLVRQACSTLNSFLSKKEERPFVITLDVFDKHKELIDTELTFYSDHAISEIKLFYPDEYLMFELLSTGQELDFNEYSKETQYLKHLINYQLIRKVCDNSGYTPNIPVIAQRVAHESRSKDNRGLIYPIIDSSVRQPWLIRRIDEISNDFSVLQKIVSTGKTISLFGSNSFPEGVELKSTNVVSNKQTFLSFINTVNRCFVESIERYGKDISKKEYFWSDIKREYPYLWPALHRIKVYRNEADHLHLKINVTQDYINYLNEDFEGKNFSQIEEPYFVLQQRILDRLLLALQKEISSKS